MVMRKKNGLCEGTDGKEHVMDMDSRNRNSVQDAEKIVNSILDDYQNGRPIDKKDDFFDQPSK